LHIRILLSPGGILLTETRSGAQRGWRDGRGETHHGDSGLFPREPRHSAGGTKNTLKNPLGACNARP